MIRVVLAVLFAAALLSVGLQAAESGRERRAATLADERVGALASTAERFVARNDPVAPGREGGRLAVRVDVPDGVVVVVGDGSGCATRDRIAWRSGGTGHAEWVDVDLRRGPDDDRPLELRAGRHRLRLSLVRVDGRPAVVVRRFTAESGTSARHVRTRLGRGASLPV